MTNEQIVMIKNRICQGLPTRIPAMTPHQLAILLNELAAEREEIHGPRLEECQALTN